MLTFLAIAKRYRPRWVVWENVPGVLSSGGGRDFASFLAGLGQCGYGWAYRVLDAQHFGVPQRRRRVFVVGHLGDWRRAAAVLFERESLSGHSAPSKESRENTSPTLGARTRSGGGLGTDFEAGGGLTRADVAPTLNASFGDKQGLENQHVRAGGGCSLPSVAMCLNAGAMGRQDSESETLIPVAGGGFDVAHTLRGNGFDASEDGTGRGVPLVAFDTTQITSAANRSNPQPGDACHPLAAGAHPPAIAFDCKASGRNGFGVGEIAPTLRAMGHKDTHQNAGGQIAVTTLAIRGRGDSHDLETRQDGTANALLTPNGGRGGIGVGAINYGMSVRRLTVTECERLQGFSDDYTLVPYGKPSRAKLDTDFLKYQLRGNPKHLTRDDIARLAADGPRYRALGNSMAVPVMRWIGERIAAIESLLTDVYRRAG